MKTAAKVAKYQLLVESPSGHTCTVWLPPAPAWAAARAITQHTHYDVTLLGPYATASFRPDGTGHVVWNDRSTQPGITTEFGTNTTICI